MNPLIQKERDQTAKALREIHGAMVPRRLLNVEPLNANPTSIKANWLWAAYVIGFILAVILLLTSCSTPSMAYTDDQAIRTIVGEASNQGLIGMTAVAEVIRTRGSLKGFYGFKSAHVNQETKRTWKMARRAWEASKTSHYTNHANHFENVLAFGMPCWAKNCVETFRYRGHIFYREVKS